MRARVGQAGGENLVDVSVGRQHIAVKLPAAAGLQENVHHRMEVSHHMSGCETGGQVSTEIDASGM
jgi:hypothetical protein